MASQSLISAVNSYDNYIQRKGIDEQVIDAYIDALAVSFRSEHDVQYGLQQSAKAKSYIAQYVKDKTGGIYKCEDKQSCKSAMCRKETIILVAVLVSQ